MKSLLLTAFIVISVQAFSQTYDYQLFLVNHEDKLPLNKTQQTYHVTEYSDSIVIQNPALKIAFDKMGAGILIESATITFGEDVILCPIKYYEEYPRWMVVIFKPYDAPETRYWFHYDFESNPGIYSR
jgi:hypothetical protein